MSTLKERQDVPCPVCLGTGVLPEPLRSLKNTNLKQHMVKALIGAGFSYREIAKTLGYKSPNSVSLVVNENKKCKSKSQKKKRVS